MDAFLHVHRIYPGMVNHCVLLLRESVGVRMNRPSEELLLRTREYRSQHTATEMRDGDPDVWLSRFAERIVRECAEISRQNASLSSRQHTKDDLSFIANEILRKF